jgi:Malectin domain
VDTSNLLFDQIFYTAVGQRIFNVKVEERMFQNVDIIALAGTHDKAVTLETAQVNLKETVICYFCFVFT